MSRSQLLTVGFAIAFAVPVAVPVRAQVTVEDAVPMPTSRQPQNLQEVVDEVVWRPEQQGVLLIVSPSTVSRQMRWTRDPENGSMVPPQQVYLPPKSAQGMRLSALEQYFPSRVVPCGDVTVFAPSKMMVLNYENLPKPSPFAGFKPSDSFQMLQGSLTKAQWQQAASPNGLGMGDLNAEQRELFLAAFPTKMTVSHTKNGESTSTRLEENQRQGIRFRVVRSMDWYFQQSDGGFIGLGRRTQAQNSLSVTSPVDWENQQRTAFGAELMSEVPARFKPGQLAYDWEGLDQPVDLTDIKTVGNLVQRVREATHVELYCDPRYASLPLYLRGNQARAGNVLKAVARGVTGTWRRLENAYVLTDDVAGLGVRHALILNWVSQNIALGLTIDNKIVEAMRREKPGQYTEYAEDDAFKPSDKLLTKYQEYQSSLRAPRKKGEPAPDYNKNWPVSDLPTAAQEEVRRQAEQVAKGEYGTQASINTEAVRLNFNTSLKVNIPSVGWADAPFSSNVLPFSDEQIYTPQAPPKQAPQPLPARAKTRVLLFNLAISEALSSVYAQASRAGFNEIWAEVNSIEPSALKSAVQAAHAAKLKFRVLLSALRQRATNTADKNVDTNILGETYSQYLARAMQSNTLVPMQGMDETMRDRMVTQLTAMAVRQKERGDWRDPAAPDSAARIAQAVKEVRQAAPVDGIVLRDVTPPGYAVVDYRYGFDSSSIEAGGYSLSRRLEFLRRFGVDPVDISPVGGSGFNNSFGLRFRERNYIQLQLPLFPDDGSNAANLTKSGAANTAQEWNRFRQEEMQQALKKIQTRSEEAAGDVPVWFYQKTADLRPYASAPTYVESRDKAANLPGKPAAAESTALQSIKQGSNPYTPAARTRAESSVLLFGFDTSTRTSAPYDLTPLDVLNLMMNYMYDPKSNLMKDWDGIVIDMADEKPRDVLSVAEGLPALKMPERETAPKTPATPSRSKVPKPVGKRP